MPCFDSQHVPENFRFWLPSGRQRFLSRCGGVTCAVILFTFSCHSAQKRKEQLPLRILLLRLCIFSFLLTQTFQRKSYHYDYATFNTLKSTISYKKKKQPWQVVKRLSHKCMIRNWENLLFLSLLIIFLSLLTNTINPICTIVIIYSSSCIDSCAGGTEGLQDNALLY